MHVRLAAVLLVACSSPTPETTTEVSTGTERVEETSTGAEVSQGPVPPRMLPAWEGDTSSIACATEGVLPAGVYAAHRVEGRDVAAQLDCPPARAVVMRSFRSAERASQTLQRLRSVAFAPSYPWVPSRSDDIRVIVGRFASVDDASLWLARNTERLGSGWRAQAWYPSEGPNRIIHVTSDTPAYSARDARRIAQADTREEYRAALEESQPRCELPADTIHVRNVREPERHPGAPEPEVEPLDVPVGFERVRCGSEEAWIPREATSIEAVGYSHRDGSAWIRQIVGWSCGDPMITTWNVTTEGRREGRTQSNQVCGLR